MKKIIFILFLFLTVLTEESLAQFSPPITIHTSRGNVTIPGHYNHNFHRLNGAVPSNGKYEYTIVLLNDSTISKKTILDIDFAKNHSKISWKQENSKNEVSIYPKDTKEIYRIVLNQYKLIGIPIDSTWGFLIDKGKIRTYSVTSDFREPTIAYFQYTSTGKIIHLTKENLLPFVLDRPKIKKLVEKNKLLWAIKKYNEEVSKEIKNNSQNNE